MEIITCMGCNRRFVSVHDYVLYTISKIKAALGFLFIAATIIIAAIAVSCFIGFKMVMS